MLYTVVLTVDEDRRCHRHYAFSLYVLDDCTGPYANHVPVRDSCGQSRRISEGHKLHYRHVPCARNEFDSDSAFPVRADLFC